MSTEIVYEVGQKLLTPATSASSSDGAPSHARDAVTWNISDNGGGSVEEIESVVESLYPMCCLILPAFLRCTDFSAIGKSPGLS